MKFQRHHERALALLLAIVFFMAPVTRAWATDPSPAPDAPEEKVEFKVQEVPLGDLSPEQLAAFMSEAHEAMEDEDDDASFLMKWARNFNLWRHGVNAVRWYNVHRAFSEKHAFNIAFMLTLSHGLEMASGPLMAALGRSLGVSDWVNAAALAVGGVISVPGLDPLCIVLIAVYSRSETFRAGVTLSRVFAVTSTSAVARFMGVSSFLKVLIETRGAGRRLDELMTKATAQNRYQISRVGDNFEVAILTDAQKPVMWLSLEPTQGNSFASSTDTLMLRSVRFDEKRIAATPEKTLRSWLAPFRWDVVDAVMGSIGEVANDPDREKLLCKLHVAFVDRENEGVPKRYVWRAIKEEELPLYGPADEAMFADPLPADAPALPADTSRIWFKSHAVYVRGTWHYHPLRAIAALPGIGLEVVGNCLWLGSWPFRFAGSCIAGLLGYGRNPPPPPTTGTGL